MLFIFDNPYKYTFWMKNMKIPIDMIFVNSDKQIVTIHKNVPPCTTEPCPLYEPESPVLYVVEVKAGFSDNHSIIEGESLDILT